MYYGLCEGDVQENIKSVSKRVHNVEEQLAASEISSQSDLGNKGGLPLTEIREELDEEGNVICMSQLQNLTF